MVLNLAQTARSGDGGGQAIQFADFLASMRESKSVRRRTSPDGCCPWSAIGFDPALMLEVCEAAG